MSAHSPTAPTFRLDRWPTVATLIAASSLTVLAGTVVTPILPMLQERFAATPHAPLLTQLVLTITSLVIALATPLVGPVVDRVGRKVPLLVGLTLFAVAGTSGAFLDSLLAIVASRVALGVAIACITTATTALIADYYQGEDRARFMALQAALMGFGGVFFLAGGGALAGIGWRAPFLLHALALTLLPAAFLFLPRTAPPPEPGIDHDGPMPWSIVLFLTAAVFAGMGAFYLMLVHTPFLFAARGYSPAVSGAAIGGATLVGALVSLGYARLKARLRFGVLLAATFFALGGGLLVMGLSDGIVGICAGLFILGLGLGVLMPNCSLWLTVNIPAPLRGRAVGYYATGIFLGQFMGPLLSQPLVAYAGIESTFMVVGALLGLFGLAVLPRPD